MPHTTPCLGQLRNRLGLVGHDLRRQWEHVTLTLALTLALALTLTLTLALALALSLTLTLTRWEHVKKRVNLFTDVEVVSQP